MQHVCKDEQLFEVQKSCCIIVLYKEHTYCTFTPIPGIVAASVASMESHSIAGRNFIVELNLPREHDSYSTILVSTPPNVDQALLQRRIEKQIGTGFSIEQQGHDSYILTTDERGFSKFDIF